MAQQKQTPPTGGSGSSSSFTAQVKNPDPPKNVFKNTNTKSIKDIYMHDICDNNY
jgi:hypothetical protein